MLHVDVEINPLKYFYFERFKISTLEPAREPREFSQVLALEDPDSLTGLVDLTKSKVGVEFHNVAHLLKI